MAFWLLISEEAPLGGQTAVNTPAATGTADHARKQESPVPLMPPPRQVLNIDRGFTGSPEPETAAPQRLSRAVVCTKRRDGRGTPPSPVPFK